MKVKELYISRMFTPMGSFTDGIEGPACDSYGNLYAVNFKKNGTIGMVTPEGRVEIYIELPSPSIGNGIRFDGAGYMYIADYVGHNIFKVDPVTKRLTIHAHDSDMNQPNDITICADGTIFASDPNWEAGTGRIYRITKAGEVQLIEDNMGTTNGIEVSPDGGRLYVNESLQRRIWVYDLDCNTLPRNKRLFYEFSDFCLDGMRFDKKGRLFVARYSKGCIAVLSEAAELIREVELIGKCCTNLTFGGERGEICYVTVSDNGNIEKFFID
jgi:gluconolactonase